MSSAKPLTDAQFAQFHRDGYLFVERFLDAEETRLLQAACRADSVLQTHAMAVKDAAGRRTNLSLWNHPGNDIYGMIARSERMVNAVEQLLGDEVYHYHSKLSAKQPRVGGAWEWHQDYGYWYKNGCLFPDMLSVFIAVDPCTKENGCMQVLRGSHLLGRIEHGFAGEQTGADLERVEQAKQRLELVYCEMAAGHGLVLPRQHAAHVRSEPQRASAVGPDLLLQHQAQRSLQGTPSPAVHALDQGARFGHQGDRGQAHRGGAEVPDAGRG